MIDLGFKVTADMAEKPHSNGHTIEGGKKDVEIHGRTANGHIIDQARQRLDALALERYNAGLHPSMANAITCVYTAFWRRWKCLTKHPQAEAFTECK